METEAQNESWQVAAWCQSWEPGPLVKGTLPNPSSPPPPSLTLGEQILPLPTTQLFLFTKNHWAHFTAQSVAPEPSSILRVVPLLLWKWIQPLVSDIVLCPIVTSKSLPLSTLTAPPLVEGAVTGELERLPPTPHWSPLTSHFPSLMKQESGST